MKIRVTPADGLKVRDPADGKHLPADGKNVEDSSYWRRRATDDDVTISAAVEAKASAKKAAKPATEGAA
jgi:hypothetical protein